MLRYFLWVVSLYVFFTFHSFGFEFTPTSFRFSLERRQTQELNVINSGNTPVRYRVTIKRPDNQKNPTLYMGDWIRYYPKIISVPPKSTRVVRFRATPPKSQNLQNGEYRAYLSLEEIATKKEDSNDPSQELESDNDDIGLKVETLFTFMFSLYGEFGEVNPKLEFKEFKIVEDEKNKDKLWLKGKIVNKGNVSQKTIAFITFEDTDGKKIDEKLELLLPMSVRENTAIVNLDLTKSMKNIKKIMKNIKKANLEIRYWSSDNVGDSIIEQKIIEI